MTENAENTTRDKAAVWIVDSGDEVLASALPAFDHWAESRRFLWNGHAPDWDAPPDAVFFSTEIPGGAGGEFFRNLVENAGPVPLIAVTRVRSLAQALAYFRAGAADYLSLPLDGEEARERFEASQERAARLAVQNMVVDIEQPAAWDASRPFVNEMPLDLPPAKPDPEEPAAPGGADDEPIAVDGLPIPALWEELPCGLLVFDSLGNLVFSNRLGLDLLGHDSLPELQDALENAPASFAAHGANHKPLPDNQWPHVLAAKTRTPRSAVVSLERRDRRRAWIRIDCQPHLADGKLSRLSMTVVNLTGELPPLQTQEAEKTRHPHPPRKDKKRRGRKKA